MNQPELSYSSSYPTTSEDDDSFECGFQVPKVDKPAIKYEKPDIPYVSLIIEALENATPRSMLTLPEIYKSIMAKYPYYRTAPSRWRNSIRHNLSLHPIFARVAPIDKSKGSFWKFATGASNEAPKPQSSLKTARERKEVDTKRSSSNNISDVPLSILYSPFLSWSSSLSRSSLTAKPKASILDKSPMLSSSFSTSSLKQTKKKQTNIPSISTYVQRALIPVKKHSNKSSSIPSPYEEDFELINEFEPDTWNPEIGCWSPIAEISRLSAGESETEDEDENPRKKRPLLSLDYGKDLNPPKILSRIEMQNPPPACSHFNPYQSIYQQPLLNYSNTTYQIIPTQYFYCANNQHYYTLIPPPFQPAYHQNISTQKTENILYPPHRKPNSNAGYRLSDTSYISC